MFLHPGIIAILLSETLLVVYLLLASAVAVSVIRRWDPSSASEVQLALERRTYLISTVMTFIMGLNLMGVFLFVYTLDDLHRLFVGAMCATGTLNANPIGWKALGLKTALWFLSAAWLVINHIDRHLEDYPLVKTKYTLLLVLTPLYILDLTLTFLYFRGLDPKVITSCCGSLFSESGTKLSSTLSTLPPYGTIWVFFVSSGLLGCGFFLVLKTKRPAFRYALSLLGLWYLILCIASVVAFIGVYYYELPTHHCPFDILQRQYNYVGYGIYGSMFLNTFSAMAVGTVEVFRRRIKKAQLVEGLQRRFAITGLISLLVFLGFVLYPMVFSDFSLFGY